MAERRTTTRSSRGNARGGKPAGDRETYKGHEIFIPRDDAGRRIVIDGEPLRYGRSGDLFYLSAYAYDPAPTLVEVVRRYIDYRDAAATRRAKGAGR
jgi:hypothetical protein